ncbi:hypothetical protein LTR10_016341 [Elasticomyces elasticus]|uniref:Uncharacterized protein n=1 Tax=Exophiala sideris TaxID=1016849 RepID=A0ABR0J717_9EURO|nr:hypothetical protein LTR10_016341 [Elasticomyces elasticus]KAK5028351.1 hypothetical protein LTS07_006442 [Exophiala sideris]KAK5036006.1 hypothetical protein LTR13_005576 [Exophiala sideris]KAK5057042.1 hypothetical protein LTR69_007680 [Exophiala sideris]KAK5181449.1 hypothetical protein LTR44_006244 [Eurotiomycetes sp. CCFEE 6388]
MSTVSKNIFQQQPPTPPRETSHYKRRIPVRFLSSDICKKPTRTIKRCSPASFQVLSGERSGFDPQSKPSGPQEESVRIMCGNESGL